MNQIKINYNYEILLLLLKKETHQRELAKQLNTSLTRVQSALRDLRNINVVDYNVVGKNHIYSIKKNIISKAQILNAENYKLIKLLRKHQEFEPMFNQIIEKCDKELIVLFGSYAKGIENKDSDIDIYVDSKNIKIKNELRNIYDKLSIQVRKFDINDLLIKEIMKNHIIIKGGEIFYEKQGFFE